MVDTRDDSGLQVNVSELAEVALKYIIARNEGIPLDQVDKHVEEKLRRANEEGIIRYVR